jgi:hypothetical protein
MDEYGTYRNTIKDWELLRAELDISGTIVFPYSADGVGCMIILISNNFNILGTMPFGGSPRDRIYVGIYGRGCVHLSKDHVKLEYLQEKLLISQGDAKDFLELWNGLWS